MVDGVRFFINDDYSVDDNTRGILSRMAALDGVMRPVVALPDLHFKFSYHTPTGVVVLAKDKIIPKFVNANCGMSFIKTPFFISDLDEKKLDGIFHFLRDKISISTRIVPHISGSDLGHIIKEGAAWMFDRYGLNPEDLRNFENEGSLFKNDARSIEEIMPFIPGACRDVGLLSLGVLGYGNHFIELQAVDGIMNAYAAERFGISEGQLCFMIHGDSRAFGQSLMDFYSKKAKRLLGLQQLYKKAHYKILAAENVPLPVKRSFDAVNFYLNRMKSTAYWKLDKFNEKAGVSFKTMDEGTEEATAYITSTYCAINFGYANRAYLAAVVRDALREVFGEKDADARVLYDGNHDSLQKERIDGEEYYVHRNGAARALPPGYFPDHPVFSETGQPVLLPSSLGRPSFLCAATKGCHASFYSACHGVGRLVDRGEARERFKAEGVFEDVKAAGMKVYDYGKGKTGEESPRAFKDVKKILETMKANDIAEPVAKLRPLAALKGWR